MEWFTSVIVPVLVALIPAAGVLIGTLAGVKVQMASIKAQLKTSEEQAKADREKSERDQIKRDEKRQSIQEDALRSILRSELLRIYFKHLEKDNKTLTQWESQNVHLLYSSYKELGGNSFITDLVEKMNDWEIVKD